MRYFKIKTGYAESEYIPIDETELEMAFYVFITESKGLFKNGPVRGKDIIGITEDYHKAMGWNRGYRMTVEDWTEVHAKCKNYNGVLAMTKDRVQHLMRTNQIHLIGKGAALPTIKAPEGFDTRELASSKRV